MVLLNYEKFIEQRIEEQITNCLNPRVSKACLDPDFRDLMIKLYEYCEEINIIEQRMNILSKETQKIKGLKPQLLESEVLKIEHKTKQISSKYSVFLLKQPKFKVNSDQANFYEAIIKMIIVILEKCFPKSDFLRLRKQINRLIRTNTFNKQICWQQFVNNTNENPRICSAKKKMVSTDFKRFRSSITHEASQIRPYVNNCSSLRTKMTRSPMISLLFPTNEYLLFKLSRRNRKVESLRRNKTKAPHRNGLRQLVG